MWYRKATANRWRRPIEDIMKDTYFHGTMEPFDPPLKGGGYDGLIWTADNPAIAQTYIPAAGTEQSWHNPYYNDEEIINQFISPDKQYLIDLLKQMGYGYPTDIEYDQHHRMQSYRPPEKSATYGELRNYLRSLGYDPEKSKWLKRKNDLIVPADYKEPGRLFIGTPKTPLNILDARRGNEGDLLNVEYHNHPLFQDALKKGYDGIRINDFAQSKNWGNVGHQSVGLYPHAVEKLDWNIIPASNFDFGDHIWKVFSTPEFEEWKNKQ